MANQQKKLTVVPAVNSISQYDTLFVSSNATVAQANATSVFANINLQVATLLVGNTSTPANSTANVAGGSIWFDANYLYVATANNLIKRVALSSF